MSAPSSEHNISRKTLGPYDVLLGRGTGPNEHIGNIRFRARVRELIEQLSSKELLSGGLTKSRLAKQVVDQVAEKGGVFLRQVSPSPGHGGKKSEEGFVEVSRAVATDKAKQNFRHQLRGMIAKTEYQEQLQRRLAERAMKKKASDHEKTSAWYSPARHAQEAPGTTQNMLLSSASPLSSTEGLLQLYKTEALRPQLSFGATLLERAALLPSSLTPLSSFVGGSNLVQTCLGSPIVPRSTTSRAIEEMISHEQQKRAGLLLHIAAAIDVDQIYFENGLRGVSSPRGTAAARSSAYF